MDLFTACWRAPIERVAIENPEMNDLAIDRMPAELIAPQIVQPFWFGEPAYKATAFYLRGLPHLVATNLMSEPERGGNEWKTWARSTVHRRGQTSGRSGAGHSQALPTPVPISGVAMPRKRWQDDGTGSRTTPGNAPFRYPAGGFGMGGNGICRNAGHAGGRHLGNTARPPGDERSNRPGGYACMTKRHLPPHIYDKKGVLYF